MTAKSGLLVANRGEIAIRVLRAATELGWPSVAVFSEDDAACLHVRRADRAVPLAGSGPAAYLDAAALVAAAREAGCVFVHPGYGFLAESAGFARACEDAGLVFVGPTPEQLELLGDKGRARELAAACDVPVLPGTDGATTLAEAREFWMSQRPGASVIVKAIAGGGGRGMRIVGADASPAALEAAFERCASEAEAAFGRGDLYVERCLTRSRHVEVQIAGDGAAVSHLWERDCSLQRRHQKLVEIAPAPGLDTELRERLLAAALRMAGEVEYRSLGTFEFLVDPRAGEFYFIEANPRLQVEHTVTEAVTGTDLVAAQLRLAEGASLDQVGLAQSQIAEPRGVAIQLRINMERVSAKGMVLPSVGTLSAFEPPTGPGLRVDTFGYPGYATSPRFDSLLAKLIAHVPADDFAYALRRSALALDEFRIEGVATNAPMLAMLLAHEKLAPEHLHTRFVEEHAAELAAAPEPTRSAGATSAGARIDSADPLAVLAHGKSGAGGQGGAGEKGEGGAAPSSSPAAVGPPGTEAVRVPLQGTIVGLSVSEGDEVHAGQLVAVLEAMKMEHVLAAPVEGVVVAVVAAVGDTLYEGHPILFVEPSPVRVERDAEQADVDLDRIRPDLAEVLERHAKGLDAQRPEAVARRRKTGQRTTRENVDDLCDPGSFVEYGSLVIAAQRRRRTLEDLIERTPADGMVAGIGTVNASLFGEAAARCVVMSYDYTVLAGTQGQQNHRKKDRLFELAEESRLPLVFFTEGGGGRPGDTDGLGVAGLDCMAFHYFGRLSGLVPLVGINSGRCFAGNAALLGCCDVVIATENSNIGMGGPAMIEGGGLGVFRPEEVGPIDVQVANGVVDLPVADEQEAVAVAKQYLSYFQGGLGSAADGWACADQRLLRAVIPENRLRIYDVREVIETLADSDSVLELRRAFGPGMLTALARIEGRPLGIVANNPTHLAGAIDSDGADKAARFMQLCDAFDLPLLFLCDTPGIMVGPEIERTGLVRHASRMFVTGASLSVPFFTIVLRKGYGLGAQAMAGGSFKAPFFTVAWPTGEFGGMGLEGAVKLGFRKELAALEDPTKRRELYEEMVERMYRHGKAVNTASHFEIDDVIDPMDSRRWIARALKVAPQPLPRTGKKRPCIDTW